MDLKTKEFLTEIGFEHLIEVFSENEIDYEALMDLDNDMAKDLIPKVGPRIKFLKKLLMLQKIERTISIPNTSSVVPSESENSFLLDSDNMKSPMQATEPLNMESTMQIMEPQPSTSDSSSIVYDIICTDEPNNEFKEAYEVASQRQMAFCGKSFLENNSSLHIYNLDIKHYLEQTAHGQYILKIFQKEKKLNKKSRDLLVDILINGAIQQGTTLLPTDFQLLSQKICQLFPNESKDTYYIPRVTLKRTFKNKAINPKGKLIDKYRNLKKKLCIKDKKGNEYQKAPADLTSDVTNSLEWLKNWSEPWNLVLDHWKNTFPLRRMSTVVTVQHFLEEWPILKNKKSFELIEYDFNKMFSNKSNSLFTNWDTFFSKIVTLKPRTPDQNSALLFEYLTVDLDENSRRSIELTLLSTLIPPRGRIKGWKPSIVESTESIINHVRIPGDLDNFISEKKQNSNKSIQPYLIVVGDEITSIKTCYVVIDQYVYTASSVMQGFDILFKMFHVLCIEYPFESEHIWILIQKGIFDITTKWDKKVPYISTILNDLF